jgi:hypothetical protein
LKDFASIVAAVKPKKRNERFDIPTALYCLGAVRTPVTHDGPDAHQRRQDQDALQSDTPPPIVRRATAPAHDPA